MHADAQEMSRLRWQGSFAALPKPSSTIKGDKITLPQSALEEILAAQARVSSTNSSHGFMSAASEPASLPSPLTFRLVNRRSLKEVYAGILEFSADEGTVGLSPFLCSALGLAEEVNETEGADTQILVQICHLPKGTYVRLRPLEAGYNADDWRALLERQLRDGYTTLTHGMTFAVRGVHGVEYSFLVDKFQPDTEPAICVVDTDIEVDIEPMDEDQARETLQRISEQQKTADGSSKGGELDVWNSVQGHVTPGEYVDYVLPSWDRRQGLKIQLSIMGNETIEGLDLFVTPRSAQQRSQPRADCHVFGDLGEGESGMKTITLSPTNVELEEAESLMISVHGFKPPGSTDSSIVHYTLSAHIDIPEAANGTTAQHSPDEERCSNCLQYIPKQTMILHRNFCLRNNIRCTECPAVFKRDSHEHVSHWHCPHDSMVVSTPFSKRKHNLLFHATHACPSCAFTTNALHDLARHRTSNCPGKIILCRFCHLEVPQEGDPFNPSPEVLLSGMTAHELADGARTTDCHLCGRIVKLRDMAAHMAHHELDKTTRATPPICGNVNCGRTVFGLGGKGAVRYAPQDPHEADARSVLGLCAVCFGPLYVSMHDPSGKALRRRIERRYLTQLMTGCGKPHCANEWCKTGRLHQDLEPKASSAAGVLPLVKPLLKQLDDGEEKKTWFCVDEESQKQKTVAEMIAAEGVWELGWCVAAAEAEGGDVARMRDWLQAWAPTRYS